jgi:hypothetical protein
MNRLAVVASGLLALTSLLASPASAQPVTMLNGVENIAMAPVDVVLAPAVAFRTVRSNLEPAGMGTFGESTTTLFGMPWVWTLQNVLAGARIVSGLGEIGLGLVLTPVSLFREVPERQLFDATTASPMVNRQGGFDVVFGSHYIATH